jgi:hypothetical protein
MKLNRFILLVPALLLVLATLAFITRGFIHTEASASNEAPPKDVSYVTLKRESVSLMQELSGRVKEVDPVGETTWQQK